uniref:Putative secreted protein n=1 Tax=Ixodes ricinus TaxID=34613 RepID=A0A6B0UNW0_IXORI
MLNKRILGVITFLHCAVKSIVASILLKEHVTVLHLICTCSHAEETPDEATYACKQLRQHWSATETALTLAMWDKKSMPSTVDTSARNSTASSKTYSAQCAREVILAVNLITISLSLKLTEIE